MKGFLYLLAVVGLNAVPVWGWFVQGWNLATTIALYWCETVLAGLLVGLRIWLHRRITRKKGHFRSQFNATTSVKNRPGTTIEDFLAEFLVVVFGFSFVQGIFVFVLITLLIPKLAGAGAGLNLADLQVGLFGITLFLVADFLLDLGNIRYRPFSWIRELARRAILRVFVIQFAILIGLPVMAWLNQPRAVFIVFALLKFLSDLGAHLRPPEIADAKEQRQREADEEVRGVVQDS